MDNQTTNRVNMIRTTENFCLANTSATSAITAFAPALAVVTSKRTLIDQLGQIAIQTTKGVTTDTNLIPKVVENPKYTSSS